MTSGRCVAFAVLAFLLASCASMSDRAQDKSAIFEAQKQALEDQARAGTTTWFSAISQERDLDKRLATQDGSSTWSSALLGQPWKYDTDDEEYWAFTLVLAERLDAKSITPAEFDSLRLQKRNEITRNRSVVNSSAEAAAAAQRAAQNAAKPKVCRSTSDVTGSVTTTCE